MDRVWLVIVSEGEYSGYFAYVMSAWDSREKAANEVERLRAWREKYDAEYKEYYAKRLALWNELKPGPYPFWHFYSKEKEKEFYSKDNLIEPKDPRFERAGMVEVLLGVSGEYWPERV